MANTQVTQVTGGKEWGPKRFVIIDQNYSETKVPSPAELKRVQNALKVGHIAVLRSKLFSGFSGVLASGGEFLCNDGRYSTAATDGWNTFYNTNLILSLIDGKFLTDKDEEAAKGTNYGQRALNLVMIHEAIHKAYSHASQNGMWSRLWKAPEGVDIHKLDPENNEEHAKIIADVMIRQKAFGIAIDIMVNGLIHKIDPEGNEIAWPVYVPAQDPNSKDKLKDGMQLIQGTKWKHFAIPPQPWAEGLSVGQIFKKLFESKDKREKGEGSSPGTGIPSWEDAESDEHLLGMFDPSDPKTKEQQTQIERLLRSSRMIRKMTGMGTGEGDGNERELGELFEPQLPWQSILKDLLSQTSVPGQDFSTWSRVSRRAISRGELYPGTQSVAPGRMLLAGDVSGSCFADFEAFLSELIGICQSLNPSEVDLMMVDMLIQRVQKFVSGEYHNMKADIKPKGGGGTDMRVIFSWMRDQMKNGVKYDAVVIFSDGETPYPDRADLCGVPTFWVLNTPSIKAPVGETIYMPSLGFVQPVTQDEDD